MSDAELTAALAQANEARRRIAAKALTDAARDRVANPADVTAFVDLDSLDVAEDGTVNTWQVQLTVDAVRERYSGIIWRPADHPDQLQREPARGLVKAPQVPRRQTTAPDDPSAGLNIDYVTRYPEKFSPQTVEAAKARKRAQDPDVYARVDAQLERLRSEGRMGEADATDG